MYGGGDGYDQGPPLLEPLPESPPWPAWKSRWMTRATVAVIVFGGQLLIWLALAGRDSSRWPTLLVLYSVPALLAALVLLAGVVQQRRATRR
jgi:hypothetical protein